MAEFEWLTSGSVHDVGAEEEIPLDYEHDDEEDSETEDGNAADAEDDDEKLVSDIDRINRALGIDEPRVGEPNFRQHGDENPMVFHVDSDDSDAEKEYRHRYVASARASGFLDDEQAEASAGNLEEQGAGDTNAYPSTIGGCDLSQDISDLVMQESGSSLQMCLNMNRMYQEFIVSAIDDLEVLLLNNREQQKYLQDSLQMACEEGRLKHGSLISMRKRRFPYFKVSGGLVPPPNEDTMRKVANHELLPLMKLPRLWPVSELSILEKEVEKSAMELAMQPIMARKEILLEELEELSAKKQISEAKKKEFEKKESLLKALASQKPASFVSESRHHDYDWMKISTLGFDGQRSPRECELYWKNFVHPSISKKKWTKQELVELKSLVETHGLNNWDLVAEELQTSRLAVQCAEKHLTTVNHHLGPWSVEEKHELARIVEACRIGDYIPFHIVAYTIEGRTSAETWRQWTYIVDPSIHRGRWTQEEDTLLLTAVWLLGAKNWFNIKNFVKTRTDIQCYERWKNALDPSLRCTEFSRTEDEMLLQLVKEYGNKWSVIGKHLYRNDNRCLHRYKCLMKHKEEVYDEKTRLHTLPKKNLIMRRKQLYSNVAARLAEISNDLGFSLTYLKLRRNINATATGFRQMSAGEVKLAEHLRNCKVESVIEAMKQKPGPVVRKQSFVERGIQEFFKLSLRRRHRGRPPRIYEIEDDDVAYHDAVHEFHGLLFPPAESKGNRSPILPPMTHTMQAFRNMLLMRCRLGNVEKQKNTDAGTSSGELVVGSFPSDLSYNQLFQQFVALFTWPALLSALKPPEEPPKPAKIIKRKPGRKRTLGEVKDEEFKCFAKPTSTGDSSISFVPAEKRKKGRPRKDYVPVPKEPSRRSARNPINPT